ncbi:hypothetical protein L195_g012615 [Trifolium pratense]|uniref:Uncharacterized protein n=1 Tax=Trifolium pratense TaxID=57577 RepID=A0A2K3PKV4_TRIPR|nr:hypothetical protein L195_g012615 [Trifolium pratense]
MASCENNDASLVDIDFEAFEIDENLLRELLEEEEGKSENVHGNKECIVESLEESNVNNPNLMCAEHEGKQDNCLEQNECQYVHDFEWLNMMDMTEPSNQLDEVMKMNWFVDDVVEKLEFDFGYANGECCPQIYDGHFSSDASYGCLWENY